MKIIRSGFLLCFIFFITGCRSDIQSFQEVNKVRRLYPYFAGDNYECLIVPRGAVTGIYRTLPFYFGIKDGDFIEMEEEKISSDLADLLIYFFIVFYDVKAEDIVVLSYDRKCERPYMLPRDKLPDDYQNSLAMALNQKSGINVLIADSNISFRDYDGRDRSWPRSLEGNPSRKVYNVGINNQKFDYAILRDNDDFISCSVDGWDLSLSFLVGVERKANGKWIIDDIAIYHDEQSVVPDSFYRNYENMGRQMILDAMNHKNENIKQQGLIFLKNKNIVEQYVRNHPDLPRKPKNANRVGYENVK